MIVGSKFLGVLSLALIALLFSANGVQAGTLATKRHAFCRVDVSIAQQSSMRAPTDQPSSTSALFLSPGRLLV